MDEHNAAFATPTRLLRTCERNRLEKQFLSDAYECLVAVIRRREVGPSCATAVGRPDESPDASARTNLGRL